MRSLTLGIIATLAVSAVSAQAADRWWEGKREKSFGPTGKIHGYLVDPIDHGITGLVSLRSTSGELIRYIETDSNRQGRFDLDFIPPGRYRLRTDSLGRATANLTPAADLDVEVVANRVVHPHLKALPGQ